MKTSLNLVQLPISIREVQKMKISTFLIASLIGCCMSSLVSGVTYENDDYRESYHPRDNYVDPPRDPYPPRDPPRDPRAQFGDPSRDLREYQEDPYSHEAVELPNGNVRPPTPAMLLTYPNPNDPHRLTYFLVKLRKKIIKTTVNDGMPPPLDRGLSYREMAPHMRPPTMEEAKEYAGDHSLYHSRQRNYVKMMPGRGPEMADGQPDYRPPEDQTVFMLSHMNKYRGPPADEDRNYHQV